MTISGVLRRAVLATALVGAAGAAHAQAPTAQVPAKSPEQAVYDRYRDSLWLARQGWQVTGFDPADEAMAIAKTNAETLGLKLTTVVARDDAFDFGEDRWDLILLSYVGCAGDNVARVEKALKPGGVVVVEAFHDHAARDFKIGGSLCGTGELPHLFQGLRTIHYEEPIALPDFGQVRMRIVRFAAEKPR